MTAPLERMLRELGARLPDEDVAAAVQRVEVRDDGALTALVRAPGRTGARWFRSGADGAGELRELRPSEDRALPLVRRWSELRREGGLEVLAWRPGRRIVLRHEPAGAARILKAYRRRRSRLAYEAHLVAGACARAAALRVPAVLDHDPGDECLVLAELPGRPVVLGPDAADLFHRVGAALRAFQAADAAHFDRSHDAGEELAVLDRAALRVRLATGGLPEGWEEGRTALTAGSVPDSGTPTCLVHRDLHDGQLLDDRSGPALLDFDLLARGDTALDAANLLAHLELRGLQRIRGASPESARSAGHAFLEGLERSGEPGFAERLRFYLAATFLRLALVYALRPRWTALTPELCRRAVAPPEDVLPI